MTTTIQLTFKSEYVMDKKDIDVIAKNVKTSSLLGLEVYDVQDIISAIDDKEKGKDFSESLIRTINSLYDNGVDFIDPVEPPEGYDDDFIEDDLDEDE